MDEQLIGRALLKLLAENAEQTAEALRREIYPFVHVQKHDEGDLAPKISEANSQPDLCHSDSYPYCIVHDTSGPDAMIEIDSNFASKEPATAEHDVSLSFDAAWSDTVADLIANRRWDRGRAAHAGSSRKLWLSFVGDLPLSEMTKKHAIGFRRALSRLPETYHRDKRRRDPPLPKVIERADKIEADDGGEIPRMSSKTVNRHISQMKWMWMEFETLEHVSKDQPNPFDRLHIPVKKTRFQIREERDQFTIEELKILFSSPIWTGCLFEVRRKQPGNMILRDWKFWIPLIGAFSGMRREEICALKVGDLENTSGIWIVNLRQAKMHLKTPGSNSCIGGTSEMIRPNAFSSHRLS